jgi:hypothetical protein
MSIGSTGGIGVSAAGSPMAQTDGPEIERVRHSAAQRRQIQALDDADAAAGVTETDGTDLQAEDRDADGRQPWESPHEAESAHNGPPHDMAPRESQSAECGSLLDLTG